MRRQYAEDHFEGWFEKAKAIFKECRNNLQLASFDLEQVCEMCYKCILLAYTHYAADDHDLYALREEAERCEPLLKEVFPLETEKQEKSFEKLNSAYIGARYIKSFIVEQNEIDHWKPEVEKLLSLTEQTCKIKIEFLRHIEIEGKNDKINSEML